MVALLVKPRNSTLSPFNSGKGISQESSSEKIRYIEDEGVSFNAIFKGKEHTQIIVWI